MVNLIEFFHDTQPLLSICISIVYTAYVMFDFIEMSY